jgi:alanine dehydrogenase
MPGAVARTATHAFVNSAMPYITEIAALGTDRILSNPSIEPAINTHNGKLLNLVRLNAQQEE